MKGAPINPVPFPFRAKNFYFSISLESPYICKEMSFFVCFVLFLHKQCVFFWQGRLNKHRATWSRRQIHNFSEFLHFLIAPFSYQTVSLWIWVAESEISSHDVEPSPLPDNDDVVAGSFIPIPFADSTSFPCFFFTPSMSMSCLSACPIQLSYQSANYTGLQSNRLFNPQIDSPGQSIRTGWLIR